MTFYVSIQQLDYDDYPVGRDNKVGWFHTAAQAKSWIETCGLFSKEYIFPGAWVWKQDGLNQKHNITVRNILDTHVEAPANYVKRWSR